MSITPTSPSYTDRLQNASSRLTHPTSPGLHLQEEPSSPSFSHGLLWTHSGSSSSALCWDHSIKCVLQDGVSLTSGDQVALGAPVLWVADRKGRAQRQKPSWKGRKGTREELLRGSEPPFWGSPSSASCCLASHGCVGAQLSTQRRSSCARHLPHHSKIAEEPHLNTQPSMGAIRDTLSPSPWNPCAEQAPSPPTNPEYPDPQAGVPEGRHEPWRSSWRLSGGGTGG